MRAWRTTAGSLSSAHPPRPTQMISVPIYIVSGDEGWLLFAFRRSRQVGAKAKERTLYFFRPGFDFAVVADASGKSEHRVQFIYGSVGPYPQIGLGDAHSAGKAGLTGITTLCCNTHHSAPCFRCSAN